MQWQEICKVEHTISYTITKLKETHEKIRLTANSDDGACASDNEQSVREVVFHC